MSIGFSFLSFPIARIDCPSYLTLYIQRARTSPQPRYPADILDGMSNHEADLMQLLNTAGAKGSFFLNVNSRTLIFLFNSFYSQPSLTCFSPSSPSTLVHVRPTSFPLSLLQKSGYTLIYNRATTMRVFTITTKSFEISSPTIIRWARILGHTLIWSRLTMLRFIQVRHLSHSPTPSCPSSPIHSLPSTSWVHKDYNAD